jgi:hypothetical protein
MHYRSEKRATSSKRAQRAHDPNPDLDVTDESVAGRLALEAAFSPVQPSSSHDADVPLDGPEVVVKRKRGLSSHAAVGEPCIEQGMEAQSAGTVHADRAPRVFRVATVPSHQVPAEPAQGAVESGPEPVGDKDLQEEPVESILATAARRSRRRAAPVVITRFSYDIDRVPHSIEARLANEASGRTPASAFQLPELAKSKRGSGPTWRCERRSTGSAHFW